jgi:hypothetical protein
MVNDGDIAMYMKVVTGISIAVNLAWLHYNTLHLNIFDGRLTIS